jgi:NmrA-like family
MQKIIVIAGATGNLGGKIVDALIANGAMVIATDNNKIQTLQQKGVQVFQVNTSDASAIAQHCVGAHCMVSALAGLRETIIDVQKILLDAALQANVPRFIPSDFSSDFTNLVIGNNRNLDLRREFHTYLDATSIKATSIFNGAFMELLTTDMPLILLKPKRILCWGNPNQLMELTTTHNIAEYTAQAAMDDTAPRYLKIAGGVLCCNDFVKLLSELTHHNYKLLRPGGIGLFNFVIKMTRFFSRSKSELYPPWQGMQYMRDMMEGRIDVQKNDNDRYANINWTSVKDFLVAEKIGEK